MISLKDGNKIIPLDDVNLSAEVGDIEQLLENLIAERKPFGKNSKKPAAVKAN